MTHGIVDMCWQYVAICGMLVGKWSPRASAWEHQSIAILQSKSMGILLNANIARKIDKLRVQMLLVFPVMMGEGSDWMDDKISEWWKKTSRIMGGLMSRVRSNFSSSASRNCSKKNCAQQCTSCHGSSRWHTCSTTMDGWHATSCLWWGY